MFRADWLHEALRRGQEKAQSDGQHLLGVRTGKVLLGGVGLKYRILVTILSVFDAAKTVARAASAAVRLALRHARECARRGPILHHLTEAYQPKERQKTCRT